MASTGLLALRQARSPLRFWVRYPPEPVEHLTPRTGVGAQQPGFRVRWPDSLLAKSSLTNGTDPDSDVRDFTQLSRLYPPPVHQAPC